MKFLMMGILFFIQVLASDVIQDLDLTVDYKGMCSKIVKTNWSRYPNQETCVKKSSEFDKWNKEQKADAVSHMIKFCDHFSQASEEKRYNCFRWQYEKGGLMAPFVKEQGFWATCHKEKKSTVQAKCLNSALTGLQKDLADMPLPDDVLKLLQQEANKKQEAGSK